MLGCQAISLPNTEHIAPQIVCAALVLDSWYYCSGEQGLTVQHVRQSGIPCVGPPKDVNIRWQQLVFIYIHL